MKRWAKRITPAFLWRWLRRLRLHFEEARYRRLLKSYPRRVVEHDYGGSRLKITLADPDGAIWYDRDWTRLPEVTLLAGSRLRTGATVFNIGAHQGVVALMLANEVGPEGSVIAVDPNPINAALIAENARLNEVGHLRVITAAAGDRSGSIRFGVNLNDRVRTSQAESADFIAEMITIDQLAAVHGHPQVLFVDVEGFECAVLAGAKSVMAGSPADWFVEVHVDTGLEAFGKAAADVLGYFPPLRYSLFVATESERNFVSLDQGRHLLVSRFFLVAIDGDARHGVGSDS